VNLFLSDTFGIDAAKYPAAHVIEFNVYIDQERLKATNTTPAEVHQAVARFLEKDRTNGVYAAYTKEQILSGALPRTEITERVMTGYHPRNSGDVVIIPEPYSIILSKDSAYKSSHGSPYAFDTAVPLVMTGPGISEGLFTEKVSTIDIAPTVSYLLGILQPSGCEGRILGEAVNRERKK